MNKHIYKDVMTWLSGMAVTTALAQTAEQNYVETVTYLNRGGSDSIVSVQYFDGLGQQVQTVTGGNAGGKYLHTLTEYDGLGRESKVWAPVIGGNTPDFVPEEDVVSQSLATYGDPAAFSRVQYDGLDRKTFTSTPGEAWQSKGKGKRAAYRFNKSGEVRHYTMNDLRGLQRYEAGLLTCTVTSDEDSLEVLTFKDFLGNVILERKGAEGEYVETYYVYNDLGQLAYVLPPMYNANPTTANLDLYAFCYTYDDQGRIERKKLPGCDSIKYWYDEADRVIRMQDGVLRHTGATGLYRVYAYDGLDRMTRQSIEQGGRIENDEIINYYDNYKFLTNAECSNLIPKGLSTQPFTSLSEKYSSGKQTGQWQLASNGESMLTIFGYDDHGRVIKKLEIGLEHNATMTETAYNFVGDVTGETVTYYAYNEASGSVSPTFHASTTNKYDIPHTKLLGSSVITIRDIANGQNMRDTISKFTYDEFGRMVANNRSGTAGDMSYAYDNLHGWLTETTAKGGFEQTLLRETGARESCFNGSIAAMEWKCGKDIKRRYDYVYDGLNRLDYAHYSSYQADWSQTKAGASPTMQLIPGDWRNGDYSVHYCYDKNSNLLEAERQGWAYVDEDGNDVYDTVDDVMIEYNGNQRKSATVCTVTEDDYYGKMTFVNGAKKSVEYAYDGNGNLTRDDNKGITNIEYDLLGNPRRVTLKNNRSIEYVYAADGRKLRTVHSAPVARLPRDTESKAVVGKGKGIPKPRITIRKTTTDYINNYVSKNGKPEMYRFPGGYYSFDYKGNMDGCHYYVQDYQGNNRMVVNAYTNEVEQINHYYPYGALMGDISTQSEKQSFKYSGKELDRTYGLDLYDFHARQYDPLTPGFNSIDPMAEKYYSISPYAYCAGNPVNCVDPDGKETYLFSTELPGANWVPFATHTFIVVRDSNNKITYAAYGAKNNDSLSGRDQLTRCSYRDDKKAYTDYLFKGELSEHVKGINLISPPEGMTSEEFDKEVVKTIEEFGNNPDIKYNLNPSNENEGNCNTSSSTILLKSGVSEEIVNKIGQQMKGFNWGFSSNPKPWTSTEQEKAVEKCKNIKSEEVKRLEALQLSL